MTTDRELLQQALEALMDAQLHNYALKHKETDDLITALRERLAQPQRTHWEGCEEVHPECKTRRTTREEKIVRPGVYEVPVEREPVAWVTGWHDGHCVIRSANPAAILPIGIALYTTPPRREWVGMTEEEWAALWKEFAWESEFNSNEQFQEEMVKKHGKGHYYMDTDEAWNRQKDLIQKLVTDKLREKNA